MRTTHLTCHTAQCTLHPAQHTFPTPLPNNVLQHARRTQLFVSCFQKEVVREIRKKEKNMRCNSNNSFKQKISNYESYTTLPLVPIPLTVPGVTFASAVKVCYLTVAKCRSLTGTWSFSRQQCVLLL